MSGGARNWAARADRASLAGMALGLALLLLPLDTWSFRVGFFLVLAATVGQIVFSHLRSRDA